MSNNFLGLFVSHRTTKPRVMAAIWDLQAFTVPDLCHAAGLENRAEAYAQLRKLKAQGFLEQEQLAAHGRHRGLTLYRLTENTERRFEFGRQLQQYRPPLRSGADSEFTHAALRDTEKTLDKIEYILDTIGRAAPTRTAAPRQDLEALGEVGLMLERTETKIRVTLLQLGDKDGNNRNPSHPALLARIRFNRAVERWKELQDLASNTIRERAVNKEELTQRMLLIQSAAKAADESDRATKWSRQ